MTPRDPQVFSFSQETLHNKPSLSGRGVILTSLLTWDVFNQVSRLPNERDYPFHFVC